MSAARIECRSPTGNRFEVVALRGFVVTPEALRREPGMWWLESEAHPRLDGQASQAIELATGGARVGPWPYCAPAERWNQAAARERWLPTAPLRSSGASDVANATVESLEMPSREDSTTRARSLRACLCDGAGAVAHLFEGLTRAARFSVTTCALSVCAYYVVAVAAWLWTLHDGMTAEESQAGVVLGIAALVAIWLTGRFEERVASASGVLVRLPRSEARRRQPVLHLVLDAYRTGVVLQLLAFAGFVLS